MNSSTYLTIAIYLSGGSFVGGLWALVEVASSVKYVCPTSDNNDSVVTSMWLDTSRFATSFLAVCLSLYRVCGTDTKKRDRACAVASEISAAVTTVLLFTLLITTGTVCSDTKCLTTSAANDCTSSSSSCSEFTTQVENMLQVENDIDALCKTPDVWQVSVNYCPQQISVNCFSAGEDSSSPQPYTSAEQCNVYACSNLVPGAIERYVVGVSCMVLSVAAFIALCVLERQLPAESDAHASSPRDSDTTEPPSGESQTTGPEAAGMKQPMIATSLRQRRASGPGPAAYSRLPSSIDF